jgi:hypothetical protein
MTTQSSALVVPVEAVVDVVAVQASSCPRGGCDCLALHVVDLAAAHRGARARVDEHAVVAVVDLAPLNRHLAT